MPRGQGERTVACGLQPGSTCLSTASWAAVEEAKFGDERIFLDQGIIVRLNKKEKELPTNPGVL